MPLVDGPLMGWGKRMELATHCKLSPNGWKKYEALFEPPFNLFTETFEYRKYTSLQKLINVKDALIASLPKLG
jgi:hypothetical protein